MTDPGNRTSSSVYDVATGRQIAQINALGNKTQYGYDVNGFLRTVTDPNGNTTTTEHDVRGNAVSSTSCQNQAAQLCTTVYATYHPNATAGLLSPDARNDQVLTTRDGRSASPTDNTYRTSYTYDVDGTRTAVTTPPVPGFPAGRTTRYVYSSNKPDVIGRLSDGTAQVRHGTGPDTFDAGTAFGSGWNAYNWIGFADINQDGKQDIIGRLSDGTAQVRHGTGPDTFDAGTAFGSGWNVFTWIGFADVNQDGKQDIIGRLSTGVAMVYHGTGPDTFATGTPFGSGWNTFTWIDFADVNQDGKQDIIGRLSTGVAMVYHGTGPDTFDAGTAFGSGWNAYTWINVADTNPGATTAALDGGYVPPGLPTAVITPGGATQTIAYNRTGDVARVTDPAGKVTAFTYDGLGRVLTTTETTDTFPAGLTTSFSYDKLNRMLAQTAPAVTNRVTGAVHTARTTIAYDVDGQVASQTVADLSGGDAARTASWTYNARGQRITATDAAGRITRYEYDAYGNLVRETTPDGRVFTSAFDAAGQLLTTTLVGYTGDPNNPSPPADVVLISKAYDPAGRLASDTDAMGWVASYAYTDNALPATVTRRDPASGATFVTQANGYDAGGNRTSSTANNGLTTTTFVVDAARRVTSSTLDPAGVSRTTAYTYSPDDLVLTATTSNGAGTVGIVDATYNATGRMTSRTVHNGSYMLTTMWTVDQGGLATAVSDPNGNTTNYAYDEAGRLVVSTAPAVNVETGGGTPVSTRPVSYLGYDTFGEQTESKDPDGNVIVAGFDATGRHVSTRLPAYTPPGASTPITPIATKTYDDAGRLASSTDPLGNVSSYTYDQLGNLAKVTAPNLGETRATYDLLGDRLTVTDPTGAVSTATYDYLGRQLTSTEVVRQFAANYTTTYTYGSGGWLASVRSPAGVTTSATYNAAGETLTTTDGAGNATSYLYDGAGRRIRSTLPDGTYSTVTYDMAGRATATTAYDNAGTVRSTRSAAFDAAGNMTSATDARGDTTSFGYDATGKLISQVQPVTASSSISITFGYDAAGNRTRYTDGRGNPFITTYNTWGQPESRIEPSTAAYPNLADRTFTVAYDVNGRVASRTAPGGVQVTNTYNVMGDLTGQTGTGAQASTTARSFGYDLAGRLTSASAPGGTNTFGYDDRGLLLSTSGPSGTSSFTYTADGLIASRDDAAGTTTYTYDTAGRLATAANATAGLNLSIAYNTLSQPSRVTYGTAGNYRDFGYDALHRLSADTLKTSGGATVASIGYGPSATTPGIGSAAVAGRPTRTPRGARWPRP